MIRKENKILSFKTQQTHAKAHKIPYLKKLTLLIVWLLLKTSHNFLHISTQYCTYTYQPKLE